MAGTPASVRDRQSVLRAGYRRDPASAWVVDQAQVASADLHDPFHGRVRFGGAARAEVGYAVHGALGGPHDAPVPGDLLCAALASCQESALRMVANLYQVRLTELQVDVRAAVDVRGTLGMADVPVAFQSLQVAVRLRAAPDTDPDRLRQVVKAAERSCVVLQTLRAGVAATVDVDAASASSAEHAA